MKYYYPTGTFEITHTQIKPNTTCQSNVHMWQKSTLYSTYRKVEFGMHPQSMPTEWTHARTLRSWQSVRLDL